MAAESPRQREAELRTTSAAPRAPGLLAVLLWALVALVCLAGIGTMLILPPAARAGGLVYGGF